MNIYYVYFYLRDDFTPYYVGKGKGRRYKEKHNVKVPKDESKIIFVETKLTELQSFIIERYYIRWFGRKDNGTGILRNLTDGGEGASGHIISEKQKRLLSEKRKGNKNPMYGIEPWNKGKTWDEKTKIKIKEKRKNQIITEESNIKRSLKLKGRKVNHKIETCIRCGITTIKPMIVRWHNDNCKKRDL